MRKEDRGWKKVALMAVSITSLLAFFVCLSMVASCSVKERREFCPCRLRVDFEHSSAIGSAVLLAVNDGSTVVYSESLDKKDCEAPRFIDVPKGMLTIYAFECILSGCTLDGASFKVKEGGQMDSLWADSKSVDCRGGEASVTMRRNKQFATLHVSMEKCAAELARYTYRLESAWCGLDLATLAPIPGGFDFSFGHAGTSPARARLPRLGDGAVKLTVIFDDGQGRVETPVDLGAMLSLSGYDWKAESLEDIFVSLDLASGTADVSVADWEKGDDQKIRRIEF